MGLLYYLSRPFWRLAATRTVHITTRRHTQRFCPRVLSLEDRTVPAADAFADAVVLSGAFSRDTGNNLEATAEIGEPLHANGDTTTNSLWWRWTATADEPVEINTFGSDFDTLLAVYTGSSVDALDLVAANDDSNCMQSEVMFDAVAGTTYSIAVDGYGDATGNIVLHLGTTPANDNFANATVVAGGTVNGHNLAATEETGEPNAAGVSDPINSVWWSWTAAADGPVEINTFDSDFDTLLAVYTGSSVDSLTLVTTNDDAGDGLQSQVLFDAVAGTTYAIAVDGILNITGSIVLNLPAAPTVSNAPPEIADQSFTVNENSIGGTSVGSVAASDPDAGQTLSYTIIDGNESGAFSLNYTTGEIRVLDSTPLDYETTPTFTLTVQVTDSGSPALSTSATITINLNDVNEAPVLDNSGNLALTAIDQGDANNPGTRISALLASAVTDPDVGAVQGIAVVAADTSHGSWQFSTNGGSTWSALGAVSATSARLLAADALIRFQPASDFSGTLAQAIAFRAWDQSSGTNGGTADTTLNGGSTAFSIATETASLTVNAVAPPPATPQQQIASMISEVKNLIHPGALSNGAGTAMISHLTNASRKFSEGNLTAARAQLKAFINRVQVAMGNGHLTQAEGDPLIAAANALM